MSRYVIVAEDCNVGPHNWSAVLPDAEHIHLHRLPDGGWTAVAMEWTRIDIEDPTNNRWRDVPTDSEDGA